MISIFDGRLMAVAGSCERAGLLEVADVDGRLFAVADDGVYEFSDTPDEDLDEPLVAYIETGDLGLSPGNKLNVLRAWSTLASAQDAALRVTADVDGTEDPVEYTFDGLGGAKEREREVRLARGHIGNAFRFRFGDIEDGGGRWVLSQLSVMVDRLRMGR